MKKFKYKISRLLLLALPLAMLAAGCQKGDLTSNPNSGQTGSTTLYLNAITWRLYVGGGVVDAATGYVSEIAWSQTMRYNQFYLSNYSYYQGTNTYNWSNSASHYDMLKYVELLEKQAAVENTSTPTTNVYAGLAKFFRAYLFVWLAERCGDIPMTQAGSSTILTPTYDTQKEVYRSSLALLDSANTIVGNVIASKNNGSTVLNSTGDVFGLTYLQWQKVINTYKLRVLISLSKRAADNTDLNIQSQFSAIVNNPATYPIMTANSDNMVFKYNTVNVYPTYNGAYNLYANIGNTYLNITTANKDPRTFMVATPAPAQLTANGNNVSDFSAYVGADASQSLATLFTNSADGMYSFMNYNRYYTSQTGANCEAFVLIGYPEMCLNIAEGINRGWVTGGSASTWYTNGINASLSLYGLTNGASVTVGDKAGTTLGKVTVDIPTFLSNVAYKGDNTDGLQQILEQKYVALFNNSGWEAYYNWRRTGIPAFAEGGAGIGTANSLIPRRWQYPSTEQTQNTTNWQSAITSQFGGTDDVTQDTWLTKD